MITGYGSVIANNIFANSSTGMNMFRSPTHGNTWVNNIAVYNSAGDGSIDAMGGKCYHPRPTWPQCGPFNNTGNANVYSHLPTHCTVETGGACTLRGTGCCSSGFPVGNSDVVADCAWGTVLTQWAEGEEILDGRPAPGSPALGNAWAVYMPHTGPCSASVCEPVPWLPTGTFNIGPFQ